MTKETEYSIDTKKQCTKCKEEKLLNAYGKLAKGKLGRRSQCNDCRASVERERRTTKSCSSSKIYIHRTIKQDYIKALRTLADHIDDNLSRDQLAHQPEDIIQAMNAVDYMTTMYRIENKANDVNSILFNDKTISDKLVLQSKFAMKVSELTKKVVNTNDVELLFYDGTENACLVVVPGLQLTYEQKQDIYDVCK